MLSVDNAQCHIPPKMDDSNGLRLGPERKKNKQKAKGLRFFRI